MGGLTPTASAARASSARIELGAHTLPYRAHPFDRALDGIARAGFRYVGVWNEHAGAPLLPPDARSDQLSAVRRQIEQYGLVPRMAFRFPAGAGGREDPAAQLRRTVEVASALGIPFIISAGPSPYARGFEQRKRDMLFYREAQAYVATLRELAPVAERLGVTIVLKPHMGVTGTGADLTDLVELIDHPAVRVCYDAGNIAYYEGLKAEEDLQDCVRYVRAVCIKDHRGPRFHHDFPIPGEGEVDHAHLFRTLLDAGFAGPCLIERLDGQGSAAAMEATTIDTALATAKANLERALAAALEVIRG